MVVLSVVFFTVGKVADIAVVRTLILLNAVVVWLLINFGHTFFAWSGGPRQASIRYASTDPMVKPAMYDRVIILPKKKNEILEDVYEKFTFEISSFHLLFLL